MLGQGTGLKLGGGLGGGTGLGLNLGGGLGQQTGLQLGGGGLGGLGTGLGQQTTSQAGGLSLGGGLTLGGGLGVGTSGLWNTNKGLLGGLNLAGTQRSQASTAPTGGLGIFNLTATSQQQQQQQQLQLQQDNRLKTQLAIKAPGIFGDERDQILVKFNMLQACCGTGQGLVSYNGQAQTVEFTTDNPVCRFKTICYNRLPSLRNEDGLVSLQFKKKDSQLLAEQDTIRTTLQSIVGNPSIQVVVESIRPLPDGCSEMTIYILEKPVLGASRRLLAADVFMFLQNASRKPHLEKLGVAYLYPKTGLSEENLKAYLQTPPAGINPQLWEQSKLENPDPSKFIPVPVVGSAALTARMKQQEQECKQQQSRLELLSDEINQLRMAHSVTIAKISEHKRKQVELSHRVLKVMVAQESMRKIGYSVQPAEELLRSRLEAIQSELDAPLQFKGRLNELMSQLRMQTQVPGARADQLCALDPILLDEIRQHLGQQQGALSQLVKVIREDTEDLQCIEEGLQQT